MGGTIWPLSPHTGAKHAILNKYLGAWYPKMASWQNRLVFIDGFAGPGEYSKGERGSPVIALRAAIDHKHDLSNCELLFLFVEEDNPRFTHLEATVKAIPKPPHIQAHCIEGAFTDVMEQLFRRLDGKPMAPALIMVDPFGVKGVTYQTIKRLAAYRSSELLISFMYESVTRWLDSPQFEPHLDAFFGTSDWRKAIQLHGSERRDFLTTLYVEQLRSAGLQHVRTFEMRDSGNRTEYFLIFGTHHKEGLNVIKQAMWAVDPSGQFQFSDFTDPNQPTLFAMEPDYRQLQNLIIAHFSRTTTTIEAIEDFVIVETAFLTTHVRKPILVPLEDTGKIEVSNRMRRHTYPAGTGIRFL